MDWTLWMDYSLWRWHDYCVLAILMGIGIEFALFVILMRRNGWSLGE